MTDGNPDSNSTRPRSLGSRQELEDYFTRSRKSDPAVTNAARAAVEKHLADLNSGNLTPSSETSGSDREREVSRSTLSPSPRTKEMDSRVVAPSHEIGLDR